ncbi:CRM-domain containing factor CFM3, chloroplastic/mitochondrial isoform X2 [Sorghum bicolor]|uniref:CRM-domain containing factor CFM3, chloroplastic/mitochondrial isoform X2 n=1 Tax=Sorghum bicolor TaxID=4558 RepID=UPI000B4256D7|nr:CRM-domain containing factor CFM3, chloroplastic/mitochondrial isoform X2 [Sorghum bicolor]|eukprot:XP_021310097.1 CRM-domain containing factor CFM3, chloroplastic/mitochondrial isoform X2 [Sorghum bicolor]
MALHLPPPALSTTPPFLSALRPARLPCVRCTRTNTATASVSSSPPASASSPSASSPVASDGAGGRKSKKKSRPLKPSFEEHALRRWSSRAPSQRASVPWEQPQQQSPSLPHRDSRESGGAGGRNRSGGGSSATLRSIVDYFGGVSSNDDGVGAEEGAWDTTAVQGEAAREQDDGSHFRPSYLLGSQPVSAPWIHGEESTSDRVSGPVAEGEEGMDMSDVSDDELSLEDRDKEEIDDGEELPTGSSEEQLYDDYATPTVNSSYEVDLSADRDSYGGRFDRSMRQGSVNTIVKTLRGSMEESDPNAAIELSNAEDFVQKLGPVLLPWEREEEDDEAFSGGRVGRRSNTELAERTIPEPELRRLRDTALRMKERIKVGPGGVTQDIVESIHRKWKVDEVVKMRFEGPPSLNMKRTHDLLEDRTGGVVIWRSGRSVVLYRGMNYNLQCVQSYAKSIETDSGKEVDDASSAVSSHGGHNLQDSREAGAKRLTSTENFSLESSETFDIDNFLDQLGPRYRDWSGRGPVPVDADLLPGVVHGYKPPFRVLPYKIKSTLRDKEMTTLRRLSRQTAPHFALGRNREHQGLAAAMVKLWEKSAIAKIAIKRGVPNTCNDRMAEEIKKLTGGVLLSRNKEYIVFYRGNDFIAPKVRQVLVEKQEQAITQQDEEELARLKASASIITVPKGIKGPLVAGTLTETTEAKSRWGMSLNDKQREEEMKRLSLLKHTSLLKNLKRKLILAKTKVAKAERALAKVQEFLSPAELPTDLETVTDEERFLFRRIGLKMRAFLMLGRREVFDGTVQNMHLHWKHRELVKIIVRGKSFAQVKHIAISLEAESEGVLISLDKTSKGYAIIFYRGKNYRRPQIMKPRNLLTRRQALARSIELQRREALKHHISSLQGKIWKLQSQLVASEKQDLKLLQTVEDDLSSDDDDDVEDDGEEAYLQTYSSADEEDVEDDANNEYI